jgi:MFS family permease
MPEEEETANAPTPVDPVSLEGAPRKGVFGQFREGLGPSGLVALLVLAGLAAAQNFDNGAFGVLAPEIRHTFGLNNAGIDTVSGLTGAMPLLGSVFIGNLGDRGDRVRIARFSAVLWGVTAILTGLAPLLAVLVIARLLGGVGLLSTGTIYPSLLTDYYPLAKRAQVLTVFLLASTGLGLVASPLAGALADAFGWRSTFVLLALPTFVLAYLLRLIREPKHHRAVSEVTESDVGVLPPDMPPPGTMREGFRILRRAPTIRRIWWGAFILGGAAAPMSTLVSNFFKDVYHMGSFGRGAVVSLVGSGALVGLVVSGVLSQRMLADQRIRTLPTISGGAAVVFALFVLVMAATPVLWIAVTAAGFAGIGLGGFLPPYTTVVSLVTPASLRSQAYAWSTVFFAFGAIAVSIFVGTLADAAGQRTALGALAVVLALGGAVLGSARRFVEADARDHAPIDPGLVP